MITRAGSLRRGARPPGQEPAYLSLTTRGRRTGHPREIEIWFTRYRGRYYLVAEHRESAQWVRNIMADLRVAFRVGEERFAGRARVVDPRAEPGLSRAVQERSAAKYGWGEGLVVELTPGRARPRRPARRRAR